VGRLLAILLITLLLYSSVALGRIGPASAATIVVPDQFATIQEAINNANDGDTIFVRNGTYGEDLVVNKSVSLLGENKLGTIISGARLPEEVVLDINASASNILISNFTIRSGYVGISVTYGSNIVITNNIIDDNMYVGIDLWSQPNVTIIGNTISHTRGFLDSTAIGGDSSGNTTMIYHNNFIDNDVMMLWVPAIWDNGYPSGGNFWDGYGSDLYSGPYQNETGSDGIADGPKKIFDWVNEHVYDRYPLIFPYGYVPSPDLNQDGTINIIDLVKIALAYGSVPGMPIWNPYVDLNQDSTINILDLVAVAVHFGQQWTTP
jgi:nitrous oxidase accessory protein NosD